MEAMVDRAGPLDAPVDSAETPSFLEIVEANKRNVYYLALDLTGNHHDAEDLSQEVFIRAYQSIRDFRGDAKMSSWLYRITVNMFIDSKRRRALRFLPIWDRKGEAKGEPVCVVDGSIQANPDHQLEASQIQENIDEALNRLTARERAVFVLRHYNGLLLKEVADVLGMAEGSVKSLLFRAVRKLQKELVLFAPKGRDS